MHLMVHYARMRIGATMRDFAPPAIFECAPRYETGLGNQSSGTRTHSSQGLELGDLAAKSKRNADAFFDATDLACKPESAGFKRAAPVKAPAKSKVAKIDTTGMKSISSFFGKK